MENFKDYFKNITLFVLWLFIPLVYPFLAVKWKTRTKKRAILYTFLSPLMFVFSIIVILGLFDECMSFYNYNFYRGSINEIERTTEIEFPHFKTIVEDHQIGKKAFNGDYTKSYTVKLNSNDINLFYSKIDKKIRETENNNKINWRKENNHYRFSHIIQNSRTADEFLELDINKETNIAVVKYGNW